MKKIVPLLLIMSASCTTTVKSVEVVLDGSKSYDLSGKIVKYEWKQLKGAKSGLLVTDRMVTNAYVKNGIYLFELTVWNEVGKFGKDTLRIDNGIIINKQ